MGSARLIVTLAGGLACAGCGRHAQPGVAAGAADASARGDTDARGDLGPPGAPEGGVACPGEPWVIEIVDQEGDTGGAPVLALDHGGRAHIAYQGGTPEAIWYTSNRTGAWVKERAAYGSGFDLAVSLPRLLRAGAFTRIESEAS